MSDLNTKFLSRKTVLVIRSTFYLQVRIKLFNLSLQESVALQTNFFLLSREHSRALRALANDYVDTLLESVRKYVEENRLSEIDIPDIVQGFEQDVSQAHKQTAENTYICFIVYDKYINIYFPI